MDRNRLSTLAIAAAALLTWLGAGHGAGAQGAPEWTLVDFDPQVARWSAQMVYDSDRQVVVLFGGRTWDGLALPLADTWEFDGTSWTRVITPHAPEPRFWHAMAYDSARHRVVLFGGGDIDAGVLYPETWEYDGTDWRPIATDHSPPPMSTMSMSFDDVADVVVLFGGQAAYGQLNETWVFDGSDWRQVFTPSSPARANLAAMAFDSVRSRTVLFAWGAASDFDTETPSTWEFDGTTWIEMHPPESPMPRWAHSMVFDSFRQRIVLFGGYGPSYPEGTQLDDTWEYDGSSWTESVTADVPAAREQHAMAYDAARKRVVLAGGIGGPGGDTWEYFAELSPAEQLENAERLMSFAVEDGSLTGSGPAKSSDRRLGALAAMIELSGELVDLGLTTEACDQLRDALVRTDGAPSPPDFVGGDAASELADLIRELRSSLGCA